MITKEKELIIESENKQYNLKINILSDIYLEIKKKKKKKSQMKFISEIFL